MVIHKVFKEQKNGSIKVLKNILAMLDDFCSTTNYNVYIIAKNNIFKQTQVSLKVLYVCCLKSETA